MNGSRNQLVIIGVIVTLSLQVVTCSGQGTAFTYQGRLTAAGTAVSGSYDVQLAVFDSAASGNLIAGPLTNSAVTVSNGLFTTAVDFGSATFNGASRWLEISVRTNGALSFTTLASRQPITATPYAIQALNAYSAYSVAASNLTGSVALTQLPPGLVTNGASGVTLSGVLTGAFSGDGSGLTNLSVTGTVPANVAVLNANQTFSGTNSFTASTTFSTNVGIGTATPQSALQVVGNIQLGGGGTNYAASGLENLRMVRGIINTNGTTAKGIGFSSSHTSTGIYNITFTPAFSDVPAVTATGFNSLAHVSAITTTNATIVLLNKSENNADDAFNFIVLGPL